MRAIALTLYTYEFDKIHGVHVHEWLLEKAKQIDISGGSSFRGIAGFGKNKLMHEEHFFELGSNVPIRTIFILEKKQMKALFELIKQEKLELFYTLHKIEAGRT